MQYVSLGINKILSCSSSLSGDCWSNKQTIEEPLPNRNRLSQSNCISLFVKVRQRVNQFQNVKFLSKGFQSQKKAVNSTFLDFCINMDLRRLSMQQKINLNTLFFSEISVLMQRS